MPKEAPPLKTVPSLEEATGRVVQRIRHERLVPPRAALMAAATYMSSHGNGGKFIPDVDGVDVWSTQHPAFPITEYLYKWFNVFYEVSTERVPPQSRLSRIFDSPSAWPDWSDICRAVILQLLEESLSPGRGSPAPSPHNR